MSVSVTKPKLFYDFIALYVKIIFLKIHIYCKKNDIIYFNMTGGAMKKLENKVAIVTGGTGSLGTGVLSVFLKEGANVLCTYVAKEQLKYSMDLKEEYGGRLIYSKADVTKTKDMVKVADRAASKYGRVDFLVNIVGGFAMANITDTDEATWNKMMDMNLKSVFISSKAVLPRMIKQKYGRIINIGARPALKGAVKMSAYGASKAGVLNLTESMADELRDYNINVNAIIPGTMDTPRNRADMPKANFSKWVQPKEVAEVISFLCSSDGDKISGAIVPVYGSA